ncbi:MAG: CPBP family intramembrane glutamic endopeptidase, partial [Myxococcota bacterium]
AYGFSSGPLRFLLGSSSELGWRGAVGGALATLLTGQCVFFLVGAVGDPGGENQELLSAGLLSPSPLLATLALTSVILVNPLGEELFYRGFLLDCLNRVFGSGFAIVLSATLYGLMQFDPVQSFAATMMGVVLGVLALGGASLRPAIFANVFFNLVLVLLHRFAPAGFAAPELVLGPLENLLAAV